MNRPATLGADDRATAIKPQKRLESGGRGTHAVQSPPMNSSLFPS